MYGLNKIVGACINPLAIGLAPALLGGISACFKHRRLGLCLVALSVLWLWLWGTPMMYRWLGCSLEDACPIVKAEDAPVADAIVILGGGMGANTNVYPYAEMWGGADRVWHAARLWKAGRAPIVITSGSGDRESTVPLLRDLGIPESAIVVEDKARNTEENAKFVEEVLNRVEQVERVENRKRILLVTSAWHMRRSLLMFKKYAPDLETIPAATDYEASIRMGHEFSVTELLPSADYLSLNSSCFKEHIGYWGYKLLRK